MSSVMSNTQKVVVFTLIKSPEVFLAYYYFFSRWELYLFGVFTKTNCLIYVKIGKYGKEIGEKSGKGKLSTKYGKSELSHIVVPYPLTAPCILL